MSNQASKSASKLVGKNLPDLTRRVNNQSTKKFSALSFTTFANGHNSLIAVDESGEDSMETDDENQKYNNSNDDLDNVVAGSVVGNENYPKTDGTNHRNYGMSALPTADSAAFSTGYHSASSNKGVTGAIGSLGSPLSTNQVLESDDDLVDGELREAPPSIVQPHGRRTRTSAYVNPTLAKTSIYQAIPERIQVECPRRTVLDAWATWSMVLNPEEAGVDDQAVGRVRC